jgi:hypothetical protein
MNFIFDNSNYASSLFLKLLFVVFVYLRHSVPPEISSVSAGFLYHPRGKCTWNDWNFAAYVD